MDDGMIHGEEVNWPDGIVPPELPELTPEDVENVAIGTLLPTGECLVQLTDDVIPRD